MHVGAMLYHSSNIEINKATKSANIISIRYMKIGESYQAYMSI